MTCPLHGSDRCTCPGGIPYGGTAPFSSERLAYLASVFGVGVSEESARAGAYWLGYLGLVLGPVAATERAAWIADHEWACRPDCDGAEKIARAIRGQR